MTAGPDYPVTTTAAPEHPLAAPEHPLAAPEHPLAAPEHPLAAPEHAAPEYAAPEYAAPEYAAPEPLLTAAEVLFGPSADAPEALTRHIMSAGSDLGPALRRLSRATREAAVREATAATAALLKVDLLGVLMSGWREHREIVSAARRTLAATSSRELVSLPTHRVATAQQPSVNILIDGRRVALLRLGLSIIFDVEALVAGISSGRLTAVHSGRCAIGVALTVHDLEVLRQRAHLELPGAFRLRTGVRLLPHGEYPRGVHPGIEYPGSPQSPEGPQESQFPAVAFGGEHPGSPAGQHAGLPASEHPPSLASGHPPSRASGHPPSRASEHPQSPGGEHPSLPAGSHPPPWWESAAQDRRG